MSFVDGENGAKRGLNIYMTNDNSLTTLMLSYVSTHITLYILEGKLYFLKMRIRHHDFTRSSKLICLISANWCIVMHLYNVLWVHTQKCGTQVDTIKIAEKFGLVQTLILGPFRCYFNRLALILVYHYADCTSEPRTRCQVRMTHPLWWKRTNNYPDNKVHGANMRPTWVLSAPDGPHIGPMNLAVRVLIWGSR